MIESLVCGGVYAVSTLFNIYMTSKKHKKLFNFISNECSKLGFDIDQKKLKKILKEDIDKVIISENDKEIFNQKLYETLALFPIFNLICNKFNIEYLLDNFKHNNLFEFENKHIDTNYLRDKGIIKRLEKIEPKQVQKLEKTEPEQVKKPKSINMEKNYSDAKRYACVKMYEQKKKLLEEKNKEKSIINGSKISKEEFLIKKLIPDEESKRV